MMLFLAGVGVGLIPFIAIVAVAVVRVGARGAAPQNSIQHVQEHVTAVKTNQDGKRHAY